MKANKALGGTTASVIKQNALWLNSRGMWMGYLMSVVFLNFLLNCIPVLSVSMVWTLTNIIHNVGNYIMFHCVKSSPYETMDQREDQLLTNWEQLDYGEQFTATRKFLMTVPIILFFLAAFFTIHDVILTALNIAALLIGIVPKLPYFHGFRLRNLLASD